MTPLDYVEIINAALLVLTAIAAVTPTEKDNNVMERINHLWKKITGRK